MEKSENSPIKFINEVVRERLTTFGKFKFDVERDLIMCLRVRMLLPKEEMKHVSLFDPTFTEIGCVLSVRYFERGFVRYDIKKGDYEDFEYPISIYENFISNLEKETRRYVCCSLKHGFLIPSDKISPKEIDTLLNKYFVTKDKVNGMEWYRINARDISVFQKYIDSY
jgi:hypothetical protein